MDWHYEGIVSWLSFQHKLEIKEIGKIYHISETNLSRVMILQNYFIYGRKFQIQGWKRVFKVFYWQQMNVFVICREICTAQFWMELLSTKSDKKKVLFNFISTGNFGRMRYVAKLWPVFTIIFVELIYLWSIIFAQEYPLSCSHLE